MKIRLMRVFNPYLQRMVWVPRVLVEVDFKTPSVKNSSPLVRYMIKTAYLWNRAESRRLRGLK